MVCIVIEKAIKDCFEVNVLTRKGMISTLFRAAKTKLVASRLIMSDQACYGSVMMEQQAGQTSSHRIRVEELQTDEVGRVVGGVGVIQVSRLISTGGAAASMVGEFVTFGALELFCYGASLGEVDLSYLLGIGKEFNCHLTKLDTGVGRAQYKVRLGWLNKVDVAYNVARLITDESDLENFLLPRTLKILVATFLDKYSSKYT